MPVASTVNTQYGFYETIVSQAWSNNIEINVFKSELYIFLNWFDSDATGS